MGRSLASMSVHNPLTFHPRRHPKQPARPSHLSTGTTSRMHSARRGVPPKVCYHQQTRHVPEQTALLLGVVLGRKVDGAVDGAVDGDLHPRRRQEHDDGGEGGHRVTKLGYFGTYLRYFPTSPTSRHCDNIPANPSWIIDISRYHLGHSTSSFAVELVSFCLCSD